MILNNPRKSKEKIRTSINNKNLNINLINFTSSTKSLHSLGSIGENDQFNHFTGKKSSNNKNLFLKIKKLITEFEQEKNEKEKFARLKSKQKNKKQRVKKSKNKNIKSQPNVPLGDAQSQKFSLITNKKSFYNVPKIKSQMQFNRYLINDFKENDSGLDYIKRSLKYQKINEDFDELILMKQIKEVAKNGITENAIDELNNNEQDFFETPESERNGFKKYFSKNVSEFTVDNILKKNNLYNSNMKRLFTEKIKEVNLPVKKEKRRASVVISNNININNNMNNNITSDILTPKIIRKDSAIPFKEEESDNINNNKSPGIKFLMDIKNKNNNNKRNEVTSPKKKKVTLSLDKYNFSKRLYFTQMREYNRYVRKKQFIRGKNFSKQIALINKEKEKLGIVDTEEEEDEEGANTERPLPKLMIPNLLFQIEYKDIS